MTDPAEILAHARNPDGSQRFYPPGKHPATQQLREALARAEEYEGAGEATSTYIDHLRRDLARFEAIEDQAKRDYLRAFGVSA